MKVTSVHHTISLRRELRCAAVLLHTAVASVGGKVVTAKMRFSLQGLRVLRAAGRPPAVPALARIPSRDRVWWAQALSERQELTALGTDESSPLCWQRLPRGPPVLACRP